ncbi:MAG: MFS transporter [Limnochordia bacterium]|nr:MFS transporter [Limnochordia bacterium]
MHKKNGQLNISAVYFLFFASVGAFAPYISLYLSDGGWNGVQIGIYAAIGPLVTFLTQPLWGYFGDLWGNVPRLCALLVLTAGASALTFAFLPVSSLFFVLAILMGFFQGPVSPMLDSMSVRILGQSKGRWGVTRLWGSIGFAVVSLGVGIVFAQSNRLPFIGYALGSLLTAFAVLRLPFAALAKPGQSRPQRFQLSGLTSVLRGPFLPFLAAMFILQLGHYMPLNFLSLVMADRGATSTLVGLAWSSTALVEIPVFLVTIRLLERLSAERLVIWAGFLTTLRMAIFAFSFDPLLMLLVHGLKGVTFATILVALVLIVDRLVPEEYHATGFTLNTAVTVTLPQLLGGLLGGRLYDASGGTALFITSAAVSLLGTVAFIVWWRGSQKTLKNAKAATLVLALVLLIPAFSQAAHGQEIVILHTNDLHGESLAQIATMVTELRAVHPDLLLLDAGDLFSGTPVSSLFQGEAEQASVLTLGFDALALGNHDFDFGLETLERTQRAGVPWLGANIFRDDGTTFAPPFLIKNAGGVRVLIVGLTTTAVPRMSFARNIEGLTFADPVKVLQDILHEQADAYDLCIVLSHLGYGEDLLLAQKVPGITAIIGGHSHTVLSKPVRIGNTLITQTGSSTRYLGKIVLSADQGYLARGELLEVKESTARHRALAEIDDLYGAVLALEMEQAIGYAPRGFTKNGMGLLLNQALLAFSGADAALYNAGGVRSGLARGPVTKGDVFTVEPFGNETVIVTLSGRAFSELLSVKSRRSSDYYQGPRLIDLDRSYTVVTSDFLAGEESSYPMLAEGEVVHLGSKVRTLLEEYLQNVILEPLKKEGAL